MGINFMQTSFNGGEWSKLLEGRVDIDKYANAVYTLENFIIDSRGPVMFRPGFRYIAETKTSSTASRLIPFQFSVTQAYILEFGNLYIRFYKDQAQITSGGVAYEVTTTYTAAEVGDIKYCQSADVLYLFHPDHAPAKLSRTGHTSWTLQDINFNPPALKELGIDPAADLTLSATSGSGITVTASAASFISGDVKRQITSGVGRATITGFTSTTVVTCDVVDSFSSTSISSGDWTLEGSPSISITPSIKEPIGGICTLTVTGGSETFHDLLLSSGDNWLVSGSGTNEYYLDNSSSLYTAVEPDRIYVNDIQLAVGVIGTLGVSQWAWGDNDALGYDTIYIRMPTTEAPDPDDAYSTDTAYIEWSAVAVTGDAFRTTDVGKYVRINGGYVQILNYASAQSVSGPVILTLDDVDASTSYAIETEVWTATLGYPSCGTFFEERFVVACTESYPETIWGSVVGDYENFTAGTNDADAFEFSLIGSPQVNYIYWIEPREYLMIGTTGGEWRLGPEDTGDALTPLNVVAKQETSYGCANIQPLTIAKSTLFVQRAKRKIREFTYNWEADGYVAPDMTLLAEHLTSGYLAGMVFQQEPASIVWCWLEDGGLIGLTYMRDQDVVGWHRHVIDGDVESMAVIPGTGYDEVWAIIERTIDGSTVRYVEMLEDVFRDDADTYTDNLGENAFFVDCGYTYNSTATTSITGLDHLEGETVAILADGYVVSNKTVSSGAITLSTAASVVHVGLPYTGTLQTMRPNASMKDGTAQARPKKIHDINIRVYNSGTFKAGRDTTNLDVVVDRERTLIMGDPYPLYTGDLRTGLDGNWDKDGRFTIVQDKPLPLTVVAVIPVISIT